MLALFCFAIFLGAFQVFGVQPMVAKMLLPYYGGAPAVWNATMAFFQTALLLGYAYAHLLSRSRIPAHLHAWIHMGLLAAGLVFLPVALNPEQVADWFPPLAVAWTLTLVVAWPFVILSGSAPLIQAWFARTGHAQAGDPYFLYAASNVGSLLALLAYPFVIERVWSLSDQSVAWTIAYGILIASVALIAITQRKSKNVQPSAPVMANRPGAKIMAYWLILSIVPSALLHSVTTHISTDIAAAPLLWVLPLALFLLTFILAFGTMEKWLQKPVAAIAPAFFPLMFLTALIHETWALVGQLVCFFVLALACHLRLYAARPAARDLTGFYLIMSFGGMLGGLFIALAAPVVFPAVYEYPIIVGIAAMLVTWDIQKPKEDNRNRILAVAGATVLAAIGSFVALPGITIWIPVVVAGFGLLAALLAFQPRMSGMVAAFGFLAFFAGRDVVMVSWQDRSFFGVYRIVESDDMRLLMNGTTLHGAQLLNHTGDRPYPVTYFHREGPLGDVFSQLRLTHDAAEIGVIGLGVGNAVCYAEPNDRWTTIEIDPLVLDIAEDERFFGYLDACGANARHLIGDGRKRLETEITTPFDLLIVDAFSSDAVPIHMLTREAFELYISKVKDGGLLSMHISNRHLSLAPIIGNIAADIGLAVRVKDDPDTIGEFEKLASTWVVLADTEEQLAAFDQKPLWRRLDANPDYPLWTDTYSDIVGVIDWLR